MPLILSIAQYLRAGTDEGDEHWCLAASNTKSQITRIFQLVGNIYKYDYNVENLKITRSRSLCGGCSVGELHEDDLDWLEARLSQIPVQQGDKNWNCRSWVFDALQELQIDQREHPENTKVKISSDFSKRTVLAKLKEERDLWESGESHYYERLQV